MLLVAVMLLPPQMIVEPEQRVADFAKAGADIISIHAEQSATIHLDRTINQVRAPLSNVVSRGCGQQSSAVRLCPALLGPAGPHANQV